MRRAVQLAVVLVLVLGVRACGVNESYDRLKAGSRWAIEKAGF
jgi:hypothetical protein